MKRSRLLALLTDYVPEDIQEIEYKQRIIHFVQENSDCFERTLKIGHITGSAWILNKQRTHALLMHHAKLDFWVQLGGHCDGDSDVLSVAVKEAQEESGIKNIIPLREEIFDIDVHWIPANHKEEGHYHYDIRFLLGVTGDAQIVQNNESKELRWINKNPQELPMQSASLTRMMKKWLLIPASALSDNNPIM